VGFELKRGREKMLGSFSRGGGTGTARFQNGASQEPSGVVRVLQGAQLFRIGRL
jgi:hypothetical protein